MNWSDEGFLISKTRYNENSLIAELFTKDKGKISGIIFGGTSKKIKNYLQIGNKLHVNYNSKNENKIGYFKIEILNAYTPLYFDHKQKLSCITSAMNLIKILTAESQSNHKVYFIIQNLFLILKEKDWLKKYIFWELELLKLIGFDLKIKDYCKKEKVNNKDNYYISKNNIKLIVPDFLINLKKDEITDKDIYYSLLLISEYMKTNILIPNNIPFPISREVFINEFK